MHELRGWNIPSEHGVDKLLQLLGRNLFGDNWRNRFIELLKLPNGNYHGLSCVIRMHKLCNG